MAAATASSGAKRCKATEADELLKLPDGVLDQILACLPIKDAVRTSILSSAWVERWTSIPQLAFEGRFFRAKRGQMISAKKWPNYISCVLLQHNGSLEKFVLDADLHERRRIPQTHMDGAFEKLSSLRAWVRALSRKGIKYLIIKLHDSINLQVPYHIFTCQTLVHLELQCCRIVISYKFGGLVNLSSLDLCRVQIESSHLYHLILRCSGLNKVSLRDISDLLEQSFCMKLNAPNIETLQITGCYPDFYLENAPLLKNFSLRIFPNDPCVEGGIKRAFWGAPSIEKLEIDGNTFQYFGEVIMPEVLSTPLNYLKILSVDHIRRTFVHLSMLLCILRSSPFLKELTLKMYSYGVEEKDRVRIKNFWQRVEGGELFSNLQTLTITGPLSTKFMGFVLQNAPKLQKYMLISDRRYWDLEKDYEWKRLQGLTGAHSVLELRVGILLI